MSQLIIFFPSSPTNHSRDVKAKESGKTSIFRDCDTDVKTSLKDPSNAVGFNSSVG